MISIDGFGPITIGYTALLTPLSEYLLDSNPARIDINPPRTVLEDVIDYRSNERLATYNDGLPGWL